MSMLLKKLFTFTFTATSLLFPQIVLGGLALATANANMRADVSWKANKAPNAAGQSSVIAVANADARPVVERDYTSIYLCMVSGCTLPALPVLTIAPPSTSPVDRAYALDRQLIKKWGALAGGQLSGTEYNGSLFSTGPRGSTAVAQHSVRTEYDNAQKAGSVRLLAIANAHRAPGGNVLAASVAHDPLEWDFDDEPGYFDYLTIHINFDRHVAGTVDGVTGLANISLSGVFSCGNFGHEYISIPFLREFPLLVGLLDGSVMEDHMDSEPTLQLEKLAIPKGNTCRLEFQVEAVATTICAEGSICPIDSNSQKIDMKYPGYQVRRM